MLMKSLLERNKQLLAKTQAFENFVAECDEKVSVDTKSDTFKYCSKCSFGEM